MLSQIETAKLRRRVQHYGHRYDYGRSVTAAPPDDNDCSATAGMGAPTGRPSDPGAGARIPRGRRVSVAFRTVLERQA